MMFSDPDLPEATVDVRARFKIPAVLLAILIILSCASTPDRVDPSWTEDLFFKQAQDAVELNRLEEALFYYEVFLVRYPEDYRRGIAAEYERAFLLYKMKEYQEALDGMVRVRDAYDTSPYAMIFPTRYRVLADTLIPDIQEEVDKSQRKFLGIF